MSADDERFEDAIRASMRAHDHEAPVAADLPDILGDAQAEPDRRFTWAPLAAAAVVVAALVGTAIALNVGQDVGDPSAGLRVDGNNVLLCPKTYEQPKAKIWVPAPPNHVPAKHQLVPNETPARAVVCAYEGGSTRSKPSLPLSGRKVLSGDLHEIEQSLASAPPLPLPGCEQVGNPTDGDDYLVGLTYESGTLWVSAPGDHCRGASNGTFDTAANLRSLAATAFEAGQWISVPPGASSLTITGRDPARRKALNTRVAGDARTIDALSKTADAALNRSGKHACVATRTSYTLEFSYPDFSTLTLSIGARCGLGIGTGPPARVGTTALAQLISPVLG